MRISFSYVMPKWLCAIFLFSLIWIAVILHAADNESWLSRGDALYLKRAEVSANIEALGDYEKALEREPSNPEILWKAARAAWWAGTRSTVLKERIGFFQKGMELGEKAISLAPNSVEAQFWYGGNCASYGNDKGAFTSLFLIKKIRRTMADVIRLDEKYMGAGGHRILGILDYKVPGIVGGDPKRAKEHLEKALTIQSDNPVTRFYYAEYFFETGSPEKAREQLAILDKQPVPPDWEPELEIIKVPHADLLKRLSSLKK